MKRIILITGGQRSGKSSKAEELALSLSENPVYLATAHIWDEEFRERVRRHQERRGPQWTNIEEETALSKHDMTGRVVVIDCVTLWLTNILYSEELRVKSEEFATAQDGEADSSAKGTAVANSSLFTLNSSLKLAKAEFDKFTEAEATYIFVTNEIGSGGVSDNALQRKFTDLQGWMNQYIAQKADEVILMVSGLPIVIK
ncbi:MAG: bifunctional adenosylcobinamide kinase/adenosylcobinamide-phosphate guanylyltransferase [Prevotella sp.]|nr:bifunctional adenosylcobinamide kinase/adenosylcobinamide-phosphate guanylyltransferase [Prevotella sp.]